MGGRKGEEGSGEETRRVGRTSVPPGSFDAHLALPPSFGHFGF